MVGFGFKSNGNAPSITFERRSGVETQPPLFKQDSFVMEDLDQTVFKTGSNGLWRSFIGIVFAHDIMSI